MSWWPFPQISNVALGCFVTRTYATSIVLLLAFLIGQYLLVGKWASVVFVPMMICAGVVVTRFMVAFCRNFGTQLAIAISLAATLVAVPAEAEAQEGYLSEGPAAHQKPHPRSRLSR